MITLDTQTDKNYLTSSVNCIQTDQEGNTYINYEKILNEDLSSVPPWTTINVRYRTPASFKTESPLLIRKIQVLEKGKVCVNVHFRCHYCVEHALSFQSYITGIMENHHKQHTANIELVCAETNPLYHFVSLEVDNGLFKDMKKRVKEIMKPLLDF